MQGTNIVGVQFRRAGKIYDFSAGKLNLSIGDQVIVDSEKGPSLAEIVEIRFHNPAQKLKAKLKSVIRKISFKEINKPQRLSIEEVSNVTKDKVEEHKLSMRILKSELQFDGNKVVVYFSSPGRVDFRDLVKDLATILKTRVELRQVGARDETKILGGIGICGREYCCTSFLREFVPVSIKMAKNQNLALNPNKVSGGCGRLLCCLTYENDTYSKLRQVLPPLQSEVRLKSGITGRVIKNDLLNQLVIIKTTENEEIKARVEDVTIMRGFDKSAAIDEGNIPEPKIHAPSTPEADEWAEGLDLSALSDEIHRQEDFKKEHARSKPQGRQGSSQGSQPQGGRGRPQPQQAGPKPQNNQQNNQRPNRGRRGNNNNNRPR